MQIFSEKLFRELDKTKVKYLVVGGVACVLHGVVRLTRDLDLFVDLERDNLKKFLGVIKEMGYKPRVPVPIMDFADESKRKYWMQNKHMLVFSFYHPRNIYETIDVFVYEPIKFETANRDRKVFNAKGTKIPVVSIRNLKKLKKLSGRPQDLADVKALEDIVKMEKGHGLKKKKK